MAVRGLGVNHIIGNFLIQIVIESYCLTSVGPVVSTPLGELSANNTQALIEDVERIRVRLGIEQWLVFGGSWGAALALLYAETHPERILGLILRGAFLATQWELDWVFNGGVNRIFPDHWAEFIKLIPEDERDDMPSAYHRRIRSDGRNTHAWQPRGLGQSGRMRS